MFEGKLTFFDPADVIEINLKHVLADYFTSGDLPHPRRRFLEDVADALAAQGDKLNVYSNRGLKNSDAPEIDMALIYVLAPALNDDGAMQVWPVRSWAEWTTTDGLDLHGGNQQPVSVKEPVSKHEITSLSSYCVVPLQQTAGARTLTGTGFVAHELLHGFGLPDLYDRRSINRTAGCGGWCCLGWGMYGGLANIPELTRLIPFDVQAVWPSAWCRSFLGLNGTAKPTKAEQDTVLFSPLRGGGATSLRLDFPKLPSPVADATPCDHYLLVELRGPGLVNSDRYDWDHALPSPGFLIWEVREDVGRVNDQGEENGYWPCTYENVGIMPAQNDQDAPLVGLCRPGVSRAHNLVGPALLKPEHMWRAGEAPFVHPDGITISNFRVNGTQGIVHFKIDTLATPGPPLTAATPGPAPSAKASPAAQSLAWLRRPGSAAPRRRQLPRSFPTATRVTRRKPRPRCCRISQTASRPAVPWSMSRPPTRRNPILSRRTRSLPSRQQRVRPRRSVATCEP